MKNSLPLGGVALAALLSAIVTPAYAAEDEAVILPEIVVEGEDFATPLSGLADPSFSPGTLTVPGVAQAQQEMSLIPGAVSLIPATRYQDIYAHNFEDVMDFTPGVYARKRFGAEVRLSIRGSGLSRSYHMRGLEILQDGVPYNLADGAADFQEIDPLIAQHIEVYKGGNGLRFGSATLGGAVNFVTPTAHTAQAENLVRLEGGSYGTARIHTETARILGNTDFFAAMSANYADGFRQQESEESIRFSANLGHRFNDAAETRFYLVSNTVDQELPGTLTLAQAENTPELANPGNIALNQQRNVRSLRIANKTTLTLDESSTLDFGGYAGYKRLYHPIFRVLDQRGPLAGLFARYNTESLVAGHRNVLTVGGDFSWGEVDAKQYANLSGSRGALLASGTQTSANLKIYAENHFYVVEDVALVGGLQAIHSYRKFTNDLAPAQSDSTDFTSVSPKAGVLWDVTETAQVYGNVTRSYEPPTFSELVQATVFQFVPLDPQRAVTAEIGTRGTAKNIAWDIAAYRARVKGELINYTVSPGIPATTFNADETIHQGVEASLTLDLGAWGLRNLPDGDRLLFEQAYMYSDFAFDGDTTYGDNKLAGMPPHVYVAALRYKSVSANGLGWDIAPKMEWVPDGGYVDYANRLKAPGYTTFGVEGGIDLMKGVRLFVDARNLTDKHYVSTYSNITDAALAATNVFYPGEGRSVFAGLKIAF
ncbi:TonB-dependent receptor [Parvibaculum sp.]|jgi:iron complex outermembrane recepter protein|uniref:TonB-dependent receptor family protein n=1 Tax=Parvibaculum sp. TaxID=2024848 RepID=UPI000C41206C|nr:TonB-dependent receptor [Parvibaculum sp.]MAM95424.1 TonB-dependent receptor [Parvibaculum sp.]HCX67739.1 TonB-dependent receptor [Rhodobiaceae bacterium]|tara:strand:- start:2458 stop:4587 length:2130 start_codon:yes stop_codon:yes gene_type:complete